MIIQIKLLLDIKNYVELSFLREIIYTIYIYGTFKDKEVVFNILFIVKEFVVSRLVNTVVKPKSVNKAPNKNKTSSKLNPKNKSKSTTKKR